MLFDDVGAFVDVSATAAVVPLAVLPLPAEPLAADVDDAAMAVDDDPENFQMILTTLFQLKRIEKNQVDILDYLPLGLCWAAAELDAAADELSDAFVASVCWECRGIRLAFKLG